MTTPREKFQVLLKKLFQFDNAELDFGIYRIMNHKRAVIERFIEEDLIQGLDQELKRGAHAEEADLARQLTEATAKIRENFGDDALDAEGNLLQGQNLQLGKDYLALRSRGGRRQNHPLDCLKSQKTRPTTLMMPSFAVNAMRWAARLCLLSAGLSGPLAPAVAQDQPPPLVYVAPIEGIIDLGLAPFVQRVLAEAQEAGAAAVVLEINTFGGRVDAAVQIRDALLNARVRTVAFVNKRAISAGALIALACGKLVMTGGSTIGAATPVQMGQPGAAAQPVSEKTVSYMRKEFRATAEARKRPLLIAEAMVDSDVEIPGVIEKGKLLTLTTEEALRHKLADLRADSIESVLENLGIRGAELRRASPNWAEHLVRFLTHPVVSSLLMTIGMLGIILGVRTGGFGVAGGVGLASLSLFFWGHWLVQLAGWEELLLAGIGVILLAAEIFVIPGFGIAGVLGIIAILAGLVLSLVGTGDRSEVILMAAGRVVFSLLIASIAGLVLLRFLPRLPFGRRLILETGLGAGHGGGSAPESDRRWLGKKGLAWSALRPAGIAEIEGERVDVVSDGELIDAGQLVEVTRVDGNRIVVRRVPHITTKRNDE